MLDTKGPEYRIRTFQSGKIFLHDGDDFTFTTEDIIGDEHIVSVNFKQLMENLKLGDTILVNNGLVIFKVVDLSPSRAKCKVVVGGELSNSKSMNFPNRVMNHEFLSEQDKEDLLFGYPVAAVKNMVETIAFTEKSISYEKRFKKAEFAITNNLDAVSHSACAMATDLKVKFIIVNSLSGHTARMVSRFRCPVDIIGMTYSERGWRKLNLSWGVIPILCGKFNSMEAMFQHDLEKVQKIFSLKKGDNLVLTGGVINGSTGNTNLLKVEQI